MIHFNLNPSPPGPGHEEEEMANATQRKAKMAFIDAYVAAFLASRAAINYEEWCAMGRHDQLTTSQPIEDAVFQATERRRGSFTSRRQWLP